MGRTGQFNNTDHRIQENRGHRPLQREFSITATLNMQGCNPMVAEIIKLQVLGSMITNILPEAGS